MTSNDRRKYLVAFLVTVSFALFILGFLLSSFSTPWTTWQVAVSPEGCQAARRMGITVNNDQPCVLNALEVLHEGVRLPGDVWLSKSVVISWRKAEVQ